MFSHAKKGLFLDFNSAELKDNPVTTLDELSELDDEIKLSEI
jgi:hypothetical protein